MLPGMKGFYRKDKDKEFKDIKPIDKTREGFVKSKEFLVKKSLGNKKAKFTKAGGRFRL
jgi:hypothetical protein